MKASRTTYEPKIGPITASTGTPELHAKEIYFISNGCYR